MMLADHSQAAPSEKVPTAIVGVGASAGGLKPIKELISSLSADAGMCVIVLQHMASEHDTMLPDFLAKTTKMQVDQISDGMSVEPNHIYVAPGNQFVEFDGMKLRFSDQQEAPGPRTVIDEFFRSLAFVHRENAIGIILSGSGHDGTGGIRDIKEYGGMTMAQKPEEAESASMPRSAIQSHKIDYILPAGELGGALLHYIEHNELFQDEPVETGEFDREIEAITGLLKKSTNHDLKAYKRATLLRRIQRRMGLCGIGGIQHYTEYLEEHPEEARDLMEDLLICVTSFFREPEVWEVLKQEVLQPMVAGWKWDKPIRIWVPGCATGEEAYSLAILMQELTEDRPHLRTQIFATDISNKALKIARQATYPIVAKGDVGEERFQAFFKNHGETCSLNKSIRERVVFASHDLKTDAPFANLDLISCRNLLIYLKKETQRDILRKFHFSLNRDGYLLLGPAESTSSLGQGFHAVSHQRRLFRKIHASFQDRVVMREAYSKQRAAHRVRENQPGRLGSFKEIAANCLVEEQRGASFILNKEGLVLYVSGKASDYIRLPEGEQRFHLLDLVHAGFHRRLSQALNEAGQGVARAEFEVTEFHDGNLYHSPLRGVVRRVEPPNGESGSYFVYLEKKQPVQPPPSTTRRRSSGEDQEAVISSLEEQLQATKSELSSTINQLEQTNQDLRVAHEEATSVNEELQTGNEELETSKEELQSLNEELTTLNVQLEEKIQELISTNNDLDNLLASTRIAVVFLDREFRIRNFTPEAVDYFSLITSDIGRPISDLTYKFKDANLMEQVHGVLRDLSSQEEEVEMMDGRTCLRRLLPYRTQENRIEGVVATFHDVTNLKEIQSKLQEGQEALRLITDAIPGLVAYVDRNSHFQFANATYQDWFGLEPEKIVGRHYRDIVGDSAYDTIKDVHARVFAGERQVWEGEVDYQYGGTRVVRSEYIPHLDDHKNVRGFYALIQDITGIKRSEFALRRSEERFRALADNISQLAWIADEHGNIEWYNRRWYDYTGSEEKAMHGRAWEEIIRPDYLDAVREKLDAALSQGRSWEDIIPLRGEDGTFRWFLSRAVPFRHEESEALLWFGTSTDITEHLELEAALKEANQRKNEFISTLAHELRNPLAPLKNGVDLLRQPGLDPARQEKVVASMGRQIRHFVRLVDDLMDASRISRGKVRLQRSWIQLQEVVDAALEAIALDVETKSHELQIEVPETMALYADGARLTQVLTNLLNNSVKYTPAHGRIELRAWVEGETCQICVSDNGVGLPTDKADQIFELFSQADGFHGSLDSGLGIGLSVVRSMIELHGGQVTAESAGEGKGTQFYVTLPIGMAEADGEKEQPASEGSGTSGNWRILVADDNQDAADGLGLMLEALGYEVQMVYGGKQALEKAAQFHPHLVLLDLGMPDLPGIEVAQRLRETPQGKEMFLVALTGWGEEEDRRRTREAGFDHHLTKPADAEQVEALLKQKPAAQ